MEELEGKVAVITGGASGIGLALGTSCAAEGMRVVLADVEADALDKAAASLPEGVEVEAVVCDVSDATQVEGLRDRALERFGAVHLVANNAGVSAGGPTWEHTLQDWEWVLGVNLWGVIHGVRTFTPLLIEQGEGHIVNTASMAGLISAPYMAAYTVSKHGVVALSETLYSDLQLVGAAVGVSVLCPGWVKTRIHEAGRNRPARAAGEDASGEPEGFSDVAATLIAGGLDPADVAGAVLDAVRTDRFYVLTHPAWEPMIAERAQRIVAHEQPGLAPLPE